VPSICNAFAARVTSTPKRELTSPIPLPSTVSFVVLSKRRKLTVLAARSHEWWRPDSGGRGAAAPAPTYALVVDGVDLSGAKATAEEVATEWGLQLGEPFVLSRYSYVAPVGDDAVLKVAWAEDDEGLEEPDALALWAGNGAVQLLRADKNRRALLEERARPGDDISELPDEEATTIAVDIATRLWQPAGQPFRWVGDHIPRWMDDAERDAGEGAELLPLARQLYASLEISRAWLTHGDFHHHNILRHGDRFVAIDPKPYLGDREYDVPSFLWNPLSYEMTDRRKTERRIAAFVAAGLDDFKIRAWTAIRGSYLGAGSEEAALIRSLL
jgi:streptomycin 6-kinase